MRRDRPARGHRKIIEDDDFRALTDSIRVLGILQPVHVKRTPDGKYRLNDGERRWRAAIKSGLETIVCDVFSDDATEEELRLAEIAVNEHRKAHSALHVARRLREMKNNFDLTQEELAGKTGLAIDRVRTHLALFGASAYLLDFFSDKDVPLWLAAEFMRF